MCVCVCDSAGRPIIELDNMLKEAFRVLKKGSIASFSVSTFFLFFFFLFFFCLLCGVNIIDYYACVGKERTLARNNYSFGCGSEGSGKRPYGHTWFVYFFTTTHVLATILLMLI